MSDTSFDYYQELIESAKADFPEEVRVAESVDPIIRRSAAANLSDLMRQTRPFSFLRLGDMELGLLLCAQEGRDNTWAVSKKNRTMSSVAAWGHPGLGLEDAPRLKRAYENATYVDFHERWWVNRALNSRLQLNRGDNALRNSGVSDSHLFMDWARYQLRKYCTGRRVLFAGAEAGILQELWRSPTFRQIASEHLPENDHLHFLPITDKVRNRIDEVKDHILAIIKEREIDTLFLSLGGAAKIICTEVAAELNTCCFDFGGILRGLTYSGADGQNFNRSTHHPFFLRVPFNMYMDAFEAAFPELRDQELLVKAQIQVLLDATNHVYGDSLPTTEMNFSPEAMANFSASLTEYYRRYQTLEKQDRQTRAIAKDFRKHIRQMRHGRPTFATKALWRIRNLCLKLSLTKFLRGTPI